MWGAQGTIGRPYNQEKGGFLTIGTWFLCGNWLVSYWPVFLYLGFEACIFFTFQFPMFFFIFRMIFPISWSLCTVQVNLCQKLFFLKNMRRTWSVQNLFWMSETISVHNMCPPGLSLGFSCIELVIQWTIYRHILC